MISEFPEAKNQPIEHTGTRTFPFTRMRYDVEIRLPLKLVRYVVLKDYVGEIFLKESQIIEEYEK